MMRVLVFAVCWLVAAAGSRTLQENQGRPCGSGWVQNLLLPQGFGRADFRPCCIAHDACYGTCGADKGECDGTFEACAEGACSVYDEPGLETAAKELCQESAQSGLRLLSLDPADQAFRTGQASACNSQLEQQQGSVAPGVADNRTTARPSKGSDASSTAARLGMNVAAGLFVLLAIPPLVAQQGQA